jgi:hypothetical protein
MTDIDTVTRWIDGYLRAWNSNDPSDIGGLFTADAEYYTAPFRPPWRGRGEIVSGWLERKDAPGETAFEWHPIAVTEGVAVIEATTTYPDRTYRNLWVIRLGAGGRCRQFTEWWMEESA